MTRRRKAFQADAWNFQDAVDTQAYQDAIQARQEALAGIGVLPPDLGGLPDIGAEPAPLDTESYQQPTGDADSGVGGPYTLNSEPGVISAAMPSQQTYIGPPEAFRRQTTYRWDNERGRVVEDYTNPPQLPSEPTLLDAAGKFAASLNPFRAKAMPAGNEEAALQRDQQYGATLNIGADVQRQPGALNQDYERGYSPADRAVVSAGSDAADWIGRTIAEPVAGAGTALIGEPVYNVFQQGAQRIFDPGKNRGFRDQRTVEQAMQEQRDYNARAPQNLTVAKMIGDRVAEKVEQKTPETPYDWVTTIWTSAGEIEKERPDIFPGEKMLSETAFDLTNLIGIGLEPKLAEMVSTLGKRLTGKAASTAKAANEALPGIRKGVKKLLDDETGAVVPGEFRPGGAPEPNPLDQTNLMGEAVDVPLEQRSMDMGASDASLGKKPPEFGSTPDTPAAEPPQPQTPPTRPLTPEEELAINQGRMAPGAAQATFDASTGPTETWGQKWLRAINEGDPDLFDEVMTAEKPYGDYAGLTAQENEVKRLLADNPEDEVLQSRLGDIRDAQNNLYANSPEAKQEQARAALEGLNSLGAGVANRRSLSFNAPGDTEVHNPGDATIDIVKYLWLVDSNGQVRSSITKSEQQKLWTDVLKRGGTGPEDTSRSGGRSLRNRTRGAKGGAAGQRGTEPYLEAIAEELGLEHTDDVVAILEQAWGLAKDANLPKSVFQAPRAAKGPARPRGSFPIGSMVQPSKGDPIRVLFDDGTNIGYQLPDGSLKWQKPTLAERRKWRVTEAAPPEPPAGAGGGDGIPPRPPAEPPTGPIAEGAKEKQFSQNIRTDPNEIQAVKDELSNNPQTYIPTTEQAQLDAGAQAIIADEPTFRANLNPNSKVPADSTMIAGGQLLMERAHRAYRTATDPEMRDAAFKELISLIDQVSDRLVEAGRMVELAKAWQRYLTPAGILQQAKRHRRNVVAGMPRYPGKRDLPPDLTDAEAAGALMMGEDFFNPDIPADVMINAPWGWDKYVDHRRNAMKKMGYPFRDEFVSDDAYNAALDEWRRGRGQVTNAARPEGDLNLQTTPTQPEMGGDLKAWEEQARTAAGKTSEEWAAIAEETRQRLAAEARARASANAPGAPETPGAPGPIREQATTTPMTPEALAKAEADAQAAGGFTSEQWAALDAAKRDALIREQMMRPPTMPPDTGGAPGTLSGQATTPNLTQDAVNAANATPGAVQRPSQRTNIDILRDIETAVNMPAGKEKDRAIASLRSELLGRQSVGSASEREQLLKTLAIKLAQENADNPLGVMDKLSQFQNLSLLLNPKTAIRNIGGNVMFSMAEQVAGLVSSALDMGLSLADRGLGGSGARTVARPSTGVGARGLVRNLKEGVRDALTGADTSPLTRVDATKADKFDMPSRRVFANTPFLGGAETLLNILLRATDRGFQGAAFEQRLWEGAQLVAKNAGKTGIEAQAEALKALINPSDDLLNAAKAHAMYSTFADENLATALFVGTKRLANVAGFGGTRRGLQRYGGFGLGDLMLKYPKTPANLLMRSAAYSPLGAARGLFMLAGDLAMAKAAGKKGLQNQREIAEALGRGVVGSGITALGWVLAENTILTAGAGSDADMRALDRAEGRGAYRINVDALRRFGTTLDPEQAKAKKGDEYWSYDWAQPLSMSLAMGGAGKEIQRAKKATASSQPKQEDAGTLIRDISDAIIQSVEPASVGFNTLAEQPLTAGVMKFARDLLRGQQEGDELDGLIDATVGLVSSMPSSMVPTVLAQISQVTDNNVYETYDPNVVVRGLKGALARIPVAAAAFLPQRYDTLGRPVQRLSDNGAMSLGDIATAALGGGRMTEEQKGRLFGVFLNPVISTKYLASPEAQMVAEIHAATGSLAAAPSTAPKSLLIDGTKYELTADHLTMLQQNMGRRIAEAYRVMYNSPDFRKETPEEKLKLMLEVHKEVGQQARFDLQSIRENTNLPKPDPLKGGEKRVDEKSMREYLYDRQHLFAQYDSIPQKVREADPRYLRVYLEHEALKENTPPNWEASLKTLEDSLPWRSYEREVDRKKEIARRSSPALRKALVRWRGYDESRRDAAAASGDQSPPQPSLGSPSSVVTSPIQSTPLSGSPLQSQPAITRPISPVGAR